MLKSESCKINNTIKTTIDARVYPLEAIYGAAYVFLDKAYLRLDGDPKSEIIVTIKGKKKLNQTELKKIAGEFYNELLNYSLRYQISKRNKRIREYIVGSALLGSLPKKQTEDKEDKEDKEDWQKDPLKIADHWEEKYTKKKK